MSLAGSEREFHARAYAERILLSNEWHARVGIRQSSPMRCSHVVSLRSDTTVEHSRAAFAAFCRKHGASPPAEGARQHRVSVGSCQVKWEGHTETVSHTVMVPGNGQPAFSETALDFLDREKSRKLVDSMFVGVTIEVLQPFGSEDPHGHAMAKSLLGSDTLYGGLMSEDAAVWSSFKLDASGFLRILVMDLGLPEERLSQLLQRLLEMETYRMMAMMALPRAREAMASLDSLEPELNRIMDELERDHSEERQEEALMHITGIAAKVERIASTHAYRFAAARAYSDIVERRVADVDERPLEGQQRYTSFLMRSLSPAMRTCDATEKRLNELAQQVARAANLLDTMVDMVQKKQNQELLQSVAERSRMQLRLQQAVEGFSIFAISYYAVGLLAYGFSALKTMGMLPFGETIGTGIAAPLVFGTVWVVVRSVRRRLASSETKP